MLHMSTCDRDAPSIVTLTHKLIIQCTADVYGRVGRSTNILLHKHVEHLPSYLLIVRVRDMFQKWELILVTHL